MRNFSYVLPGSGQIEQGIRPDFLAAYTADRLEYHYCLVSRILPSLSTKIWNGEATIFATGLGTDENSGEGCLFTWKDYRQLPQVPRHPGGYIHSIKVIPNFFRKTRI